MGFLTCEPPLFQTPGDTLRWAPFEDEADAFLTRPQGSISVYLGDTLSPKPLLLVMFDSLQRRLERELKGFEVVDQWTWNWLADPGERRSKYLMLLKSSSSSS